MTPDKGAIKDDLNSLTVDGTNVEVLQFTEYLVGGDPQGRRALVMEFGNARLKDQNGLEVFAGQIIVVSLTPATPVTVGVLTQMLRPWKGYFLLRVYGAYNIEPEFAEVVSESFESVYLIPEAQGRRQIHSLDRWQSAIRADPPIHF